MKISKFCQKLAKHILLIFLSMLCAIFLILIFVGFICPLLIYRKLIVVASKLFRPDLARLVDPRSAICTVDDIYNLPTLTLLVVNTVQGDVNENDLKSIREIILANMIQAKDGKGRLKFPELQQVYEQWLGLSFWKWTHSFNIENHVRICPESETKVMNEVDVAKIRLELVRKPYVKGQSPWELVIIRNYVPTADRFGHAVPKCVFISRGHHGLCDGYSMLHLFIKVAITTLESKLILEQLPKPNYVRRNCLQVAMHYSLAVLMSPYHIARWKLDDLCNSRNKFPFQLPESVLTRRINPATTTVLMETISRVRKFAGVSFTAVILAGITGGFHKFIAKNQLKFKSIFNLVLPLPWPGHPILQDRLTNHWTFAVVKLPLNLKSTRERLQVVHKRWEVVKRSTLPAMNYLFVPLVGCLPNLLIKYFGKSRTATMIVSNFPGPPSGVDFFGYPVLDASFGGGLGPGSLGIGMAMMTNNGILRMNIGVDSMIISKQEKVQELINYINEEIELLAEESGPEII